MRVSGDLLLFNVARPAKTETGLAGGLLNCFCEEKPGKS
jgi:hypothetical protein